MDVFDRDPSMLAWGIAGAPLLVTFVQTVLSLLDWTSETLGIEGLLSPMFAVDVLFEAAVVFKEQPALVTFLFVLITAAWVVQGLAMIKLANRDVTFAAAGFAAILYFGLFFGVYSALFGRGISAIQLAGFFSVPVVAAGLVAGAALSHDWSEDVLERSSERIGELEVELAAAKETFETEFDTRIGSVEPFEPVAPSGVAKVRSKHDAFYDQCDAIEAELDELRDTDDPTAVQSEVSRLESRVEGLGPEDVVEQMGSELRRKVRSGIRTEFGGTEFASRYGGNYVITNLSAEYREVGLPPSGSAVHVQDLRNVLEQRLAAGDSLAEVATALDAAVDQRNRLRSMLDEQEEETADRIDVVDGQLTIVKEQIGQLPEEIAGRIEETVVENRSPEFDGVHAIEQAIRNAKGALHDCRFDEVDRILDEAEHNAETLVSTVEFLRSLDGRIGHGGSNVDVPEGIPNDVVESIAPALSDRHGVDVSVVDGRVEFGEDPRPELDDDDDYTDDPQAESTAGERVSNTGTASDSPEKRPEEVLDSALYFLRELEEFARESEDGRVQYQTEQLPPGVGTEATLDVVERFLENQSDLFDEVTLQSTDPPAFIELVVVDGVTSTAAVRTARDRFVERYD
ncbi:hypothetical protein JCM17823_07210 [Halorubrum gandharaense]